MSIAQKASSVQLHLGALQILVPIVDSLYSQSSLTPERILTVMSAPFHLQPKDLVARKNSHDERRTARYAAATTIVDVLGLSFPCTGRLFSSWHHSGVMHAYYGFHGAYQRLTGKELLKPNKSLKDVSQRIETPAFVEGTQDLDADTLLQRARDASDLATRDAFLRTYTARKLEELTRSPE
ncbi:MAG TPA: hypothetical protein VJG90_06530 [Candidatus Nanoarchaeia archaeon]|nr:hypothetical protein [Candidatus Nanoarchaeia archaeon]